MYGKAYKCESKKCKHKSKIYDWTKLKNKEYEFKRENFWMLCRSCHVKYDYTQEWKDNISKNHVGNKSKTFSKETKLKMSKNNVGMKDKHQSRETKLKISKSQIKRWKNIQK